jgi:aspartate/methionine/tyrosine aminotransferase
VEVIEAIGASIIRLNRDISGVRETYAHWVRDAAKALSRDRRQAISMFDSSVPEPLDLLQGLIKSSFDEGVTPRYKSVFATDNPFLSEALSKRYGVTGKNILCTTGATGGLTLLYRTYLKPGDRVLVESPGFDIFWSFAAPRGAIVDKFERKAPDFSIDIDAVAAQIRPETRLIVISNLHNPSGVLLSDTDIARLAQLAQARDILLVVDEVYRDYVCDGVSTVGAALHPNVVSISSLTKIYGLSTLRCGWVMASQKIIDEVRHVYNQYEFHTSKLTHALAADLLLDSAQFDLYTNGIIKDARPVAERLFSQMKADGLIEFTMPDHGCICFPRPIGIEDTQHFSEWLIANYSLYIVPGECFDAPGHFRVGFALPPEKLGQGLERLAEGLVQYAKAGAAKASVG